MPYGLFAPKRKILQHLREPQT